MRDTRLAIRRLVLVLVRAQGAVHAETLVLESSRATVKDAVRRGGGSRAHRRVPGRAWRAGCLPWRVGVRALGAVGACPVDRAILPLATGDARGHELDVSLVTNAHVCAVCEHGRPVGWARHACSGCCARREERVRRRGASRAGVVPNMVLVVRQRARLAGACGRIQVVPGLAHTFARRGSPLHSRVRAERAAGAGIFPIARAVCAVRAQGAEVGLSPTDVARGTSAGGDPQTVVALHRDRFEPNVGEVQQLLNDRVRVGVGLHPFVRRAVRTCTSGRPSTGLKELRGGAGLFGANTARVAVASAPPTTPLEVRPGRADTAVASLARRLHRVTARLVVVSRRAGAVDTLACVGPPAVLHVLTCGAVVARHALLVGQLCANGLRGPGASVQLYGVPGAGVALLTMRAVRVPCAVPCIAIAVDGDAGKEYMACRDMPPGVVAVGGAIAGYQVPEDRKAYSTVNGQICGLHQAGVQHQERENQAPHYSPSGEPCNLIWGCTKGCASLDPVHTVQL
eukprot:752302-Hanusia_phi.AAC.14